MWRLISVPQVAKFVCVVTVPRLGGWACRVPRPGLGLLSVRGLEAARCGAANGARNMRSEGKKQLSRAVVLYGRIGTYR
eukprot:1537771-Prymnesium_polylepis.1